MRSDLFLVLADAAEKFGCRPSAMAGIEDPVVALDFDIAALVRTNRRELKMLEASLERAGVELPEPGEPPETKW